LYKRDFGEEYALRGSVADTLIDGVNTAVAAIDALSATAVVRVVGGESV
jgi:hypothetical protein